MNTMPSRYSANRSNLRWVLWVMPLVVILVGFALFLYAITGFFRLGSDARCLRDSLVESRSAWQKQFEFNVGTVTFALLRSGLSLAPMKPEIRAVVNSVRAGEVGVYHLKRGADRPDNVGLLAAADRAMAERGWERVVGVRKEDDLVVVYVPRNQDSKLQACVAVLNRRDLVVVSGRTQLEPFMDLALNHADWREQTWPAAHL